MKKKAYGKAKANNGKAGMERQSRRRLPQGRLLRVYHAIRDGGFPNARKLSEIVEVSEKTIHRDIEFLQDDWNIPILYDRSHHGYYLTDDVKHVPTVKLTGGELAALCIVRQLMEAHKGTPFEAELRSAFKKFTESVQNEIDLRGDQLAAAVSFRVNGREAPADPQRVAILLTAIREQAEVEFTYIKPDKPTPKQRKAEPLHLVSWDDSWYLLSFEPREKEYRTFALSRMSNLKRSGRTFKKRPDFDPDKLLADSIGIYKGGKAQRIRLRARGFAAFLLKERSWHPTQRCKEIPGTHGAEIEVTLKVAITPELIRWIFSWVGGAEVIEPASLRDQIRDHASAIAERYSTQ